MPLPTSKAGHTMLIQHTQGERDRGRKRIEANGLKIFTSVTFLPLLQLLSFASPPFFGSSFAHTLTNFKVGECLDLDF